MVSICLFVLLLAILYYHMIMYVCLFGHSAVVFHVFMFFVFFCVLLTVCVVCFISDILLIYSAVQLPVCLINLLTYLLTYWKRTTRKGRTTKSLKIPGTGIWRTKSLQNFAAWKMAVPRFSLSTSCIFSAARLSNLCVCTPFIVIILRYCIAQLFRLCDWLKGKATSQTTKESITSVLSYNDTIVL